MQWDRFIAPALYIRTLLKFRGRHIDLHKMVASDHPGCFHTHPAYAWRIVLAGGYEEEVMLEGGGTILREIRPGTIERIAPSYCHRIVRLLNLEQSFSLWLRGPVCAKIELRGWGWRPGALPHPTAGKD